MSLIKYAVRPNKSSAAQKTTLRPGGLASFDPWADLDWFNNRVGRLFGDGLGDRVHSGSWIPSVNVEEKDDELLLTAELPGLSEEDITLDLENNVLTVSGEKAYSREEGKEDGRFHLVERSFGSFQRAFTLPRTVDAQAISADFDRGVLTVRIPKAPEAKSRKIQVKLGGSKSS
ncbi:MAG: Hsp20/alpha crystallin family protein [Longimicrobiales bacterium]